MENGRCKSPKHRFPSLSTAFQELNLKPPYTGSSALLPLLQTPLGRALPSIYPKIHVMDLPIGTLFRTPSLSAHARCLSLLQTVIRNVRISDIPPIVVFRRPRGSWNPSKRFNRPPKKPRSLSSHSINPVTPTSSYTTTSPLPISKVYPLFTPPHNSPT